ncbi:MAG TPA: hypothetical protein VF006_03020 [Longimicrobium sp.]
MPGLPGTVDVAFSVGVTQTQRWYDAGGEPGTVEDGTALSAEVRWWPVPWVGLRVQAGRFEGRIATAFPLAGSGATPSQELRATVYDASLVVRPLAALHVPAPLAAAYAFAGGGAASLDVSGTPDTLRACSDFECSDLERCSDPEEREPGCFTTLTSRGTVEQLTAGVGTDLVSVAGFTVFAQASLHRYRPPVEDPYAPSQQQSPREGAAVPMQLVIPGNPGKPAATGDVVTRRFAAGVRRTFGRAAEPPVSPPLPPPPVEVRPPSPSAGGMVVVATVQPGAEVYLVPRSALEDDPGLRCRLRPVLGADSYYKGRTTAAQPLRVPGGARAWVLVVRQQVTIGSRRVWHVHEQRVQLGGGSLLPVQLNMLRDGSPPQPCPR